VLVSDRLLAPVGTIGGGVGNGGRARRWQLEQEQKASWERLHSQPWSPDSDARAFGSGTTRIQIIRSPSFDSSSFWEVCELAGNWILYRAAVVADWYPGPLKVQGYDSVAFPPEALRSYFERLFALSLPLAPHLNNMAGLDGTLTQLTIFGDLSSRVKFQWWSDHPPGWTPLVEIADEMLAAFPDAPKENSPSPTPAS
jgi:hypothetical protein